MSTWISNDVVRNSLEKCTNVELDNNGLIFGLSTDFKYAIVVRQHVSWQLPEGGWRDANRAPEANESSRLVLNFYHRESSPGGASWFKIFIPIELKVDKIETSDTEYVLFTTKGIIVGKFKSHYLLMRDTLTGNAQSEEDIQRKFYKISKY